MTSSFLPEKRPNYGIAEPIEEETPRFTHFRAQRLLMILLKRWWVPVLTLALSLGAAGVYLRWMPPSFVSSARMWETERIRLPEGTLFSEDMQNYLGTQTELMQSGTLRKLTLARLKSTQTNALPLGENGQPLPVKIQVTPSARSSIFVLEATSSDGEYSTGYLNALMDVYLEYKKDLRKELSGGALASISEQVRQYDKELHAAQDMLTEFQRTNNLAILQEEGTVAGGYLAQLKNKLSDLHLELRLLEERGIDTNSAVMKAVAAEVSAQGVTSQETRSEEQAALRDIQLLRIEREKLSRNLRPKHPKIIKLDADIERADELLEMFRRQNNEELAALRQGLQLKIHDTEDLISKTESKVAQATTSINEAERLKMNVQRAQSVYDRLEGMVQTLGISRNIEPESLSILEPAGPAKRSYNKESSLMALAALAGLGLGLGIVFLVAIRDDRFTSVVEISERYGDAIVGQVPEVPGLRENTTLPLLAINDDRHIFVEAFRSLRSALFFGTTNGERLKVILITSAVPNEGKSTIAANLARTLALGGSKVVLIDADVRRGMLHQLMGMKRTPGLADALQEDRDLESLLQKDSLANLWFMPRGGSLHNPGDFFLGARLEGLLERLRQQFDYVLIDTCPVFAADDATTLAPKVDGTLLVVRSGFSSAHAVQRALELLTQRKAKVLGMVFNRANASARTYYYYRYEDYHPSVATE